MPSINVSDQVARAYQRYLDALHAYHAAKVTAGHPNVSALSDAADRRAAEFLDLIDIEVKAQVIDIGPTSELAVQLTKSVVAELRKQIDVTGANLQAQINRALVEIADLHKGMDRASTDILALYHWKQSMTGDHR